MKTTLSTLLFVFAFSLISFSQTIQTDSLSKAKVSKIQFMVGKWEGTGWIKGRDGKFDFVQTENVQFKLDSTAILIEGLGKSNGRITHNALAILTYDKEKDNYSFRSYLQNGHNANFKGELIDEKFYWYPNEYTRYIIWIDSEGKWQEIGEYNNAGNWFQFFEMSLVKKEE